MLRADSLDETRQQLEQEKLVKIRTFFCNCYFLFSTLLYYIITYIEMVALNHG
jgi:hypothetical protein